MPKHNQILEKWKFSARKSLKNGNFHSKKLGKMEILAVFTLKKWNFSMILPWKSGNFKPKKLGKVEILKEICLEKWKF